MTITYSEAAGRLEVAGRSQGRCEIHAGCVAQHVHHRLLRSHGGGWEPWNLLHVCHVGHAMIHAEPEASYREGWLVPSYMHPSAARVHLMVPYDSWFLILPDYPGSHVLVPDGAL